MENIETKEIIKTLVTSSNSNRAYININKWSRDNSFIEGNEHGLRLFAAALLQATQETEEDSLSLDSEEMKWIREQTGIDFIAETSKSRPTFVDKQEPASGSKWVIIGLILLGFLNLYLIIAGIIYTMGLF